MIFQKVKKNENNRGKKLNKRLKNELCFIWLGMRDSNPRSWDQNPVPYRLANPHYLYNFTKIYKIY